MTVRFAHHELIPRRAKHLIDQALDDTRVVLVNGARQCGKSTLVALMAADRDVDWRNLDEAETLRAALADPAGFVESRKLMIIDEVQRAPDLLLAIKVEVDIDPRPGRYLLTGSSHILSLRALPDTLPGRKETVELWPFSQGEIDRRADRFIDAVFEAGDQLRHESACTRSEYAHRVVRGGFPEAAARTEQRRRERFFDGYIADLITRDVAQLSEIERAGQMRTLIQLLAARSAQQLAGNSLGSDAGLSGATTHRYLRLLEEVFLIKRIPAWSRNLGTRAVGVPKVALVDSGIAANLLGYDAYRLLRPGSQFGPLLEGFVLMELARLATWARERIELYHYRTKDRVEVDAVLENRRGQVVGIEIKASSTVRPEDFRGLRHLAQRLGDDFLVGLVLYTGDQTLPFGDRMRCMPIAVLWEVE